MAQTLPHQTFRPSHTPSTTQKKPQQYPASSGKTESSIGVVSQRALHPEYTDYEKRLESFKNWPQDKTQKPQPMADAGFYYAGMKDCVKCYFCNGGLWNWYPGDDPMTEHKRWFSKCGYLQLRKTLKDTYRSLPHTSSKDNTLLDCDKEKQKEKSKPENNLEKHMKSATVRAVLEMKMFDQKQILYLVQKKIKAGSDFKDAASLVDELFEMEDEESSGAAGGESDSKTSTASNYASEASSVSDDDGDDDNDSSPEKRNSGTKSSKSQESSSQVEALNASTMSIQKASPISAAASTGSESNIVTKKKKNKKKKKKPKTAVPLAEEDLNKRLEKLLEEKKELGDEHKQLLESRTCKVCMDKPITTVFLPCGHLATCEVCAEILKDCPLCRTTISGTVKTYVS